MPRNVYPTPLVIRPPADLLVTHPQLNQLAMKYVHHKVVTETDLKIVDQALWQTLAIDEIFAQRQDQAGIQILPLVIQSAEHLPWECLYHPTSEFLGKHEHFTLSRQLQQPNVARVLYVNKKYEKVPQKIEVRYILLNSATLHSGYTRFKSRNLTGNRFAPH
ncbi:MAG: hypothetical protein HC877_11555 [Thioploca sp.]|nr:hypothetical protein [Thioploca sp.]